MYSVKIRKKAMTIGGSDSSGGAGIQADLKTFSSLGVHGASVITCVTAQNTKGVQAIYALEPKQVATQFDSIITDLRPPVGKTGLLCNGQITRMVASKVAEFNLKVVVDPVMTATTGKKLTLPTFLDALRKNLLPEAFLITPNLFEASALLGWNVVTLEDMRKAAVDLRDMGVNNVLVTGGHLEGKAAIDVLYTGKYKIFKARRLPGDLHGTGCVLSALITAFLAIGKELKTSIRQAKNLVTENIKHGYDIGGGIDVVDTHAHLFNAAEKYRIVFELRKAVELLEKVLIPRIVPEVGVNIGYALPNPSDIYDVCALEGRIFRTGDRITAAGVPEFGASKHVANIILTASSIDHRIRSAMNVAYDKKLIDACPVLTYKVGMFDRADEPPGTKTMEWGTRTAIEEHGAVPDIIYDVGGHGKEAMIRVLGNNPKEVVKKLRFLLDEAYPKSKRKKKGIFE
jgi:hydroxymethylpyrimidine kinase/phosphomethylpyrimidine kinase